MKANERKRFELMLKLRSDGTNDNQALALLTDWERTVRLDEVERMPGGLSAGQPNNYKTCRITELSRPAEKGKAQQ